MTELITIDHIKEYKGISSNVNVPKMVAPYIIEAQEFDLRPLMGEEFYLAFLADAPAFSTYSALFTGGDYSYNSKTYNHPGIKAVLVYLAYARYKANGNVIDTPSGSVQKTNEFSTPISSKDIERQVNQVKSGAMAYWNRVKDYLDRNASTYPLWECSEASKPSGSLRIRAIGGRKVATSKCCPNCGRYSYCNC